MWHVWHVGVMSYEYLLPCIMFRNEILIHDSNHITWHKWQFVTDEPVKFEKYLVEVQDCIYYILYKV